MKFVLYLILVLSIKAHASISCKEILGSGLDILKEIESDLKEGKDIDDNFAHINKLIESRPECISYEKLKLSSNQIARFKKSIYAPDRSFNLDKEKCTTIEVDTTHMPQNNDQGNLGWCYAFSATDLLSFYEKKKFSAYDVALFQKNFSLKNTYDPNIEYADEGEYPSDAIRDILLNNSKGLCLESEVNFTQGDWFKLSELIYNLTKKNSKNLQEIICENKFNEREVFKDFSDDILNILNKLAPVKRASATLDLMCKNRTKLQNDYKIHEAWINDPKAKTTREYIVEELDKVLSNREPATITYASKLLTKGVNSIEEADHASTVIGRKFNEASGQCEYLIKNSWGGGDCQRTSSIKCENGNYWVPRTALKNNIREITFLVKQ